MYLRASEMSKQAWSEAVKTNNLEEHMLEELTSRVRYAA